MEEETSESVSTEAVGSGSESAALDNGAMPQGESRAFTGSVEPQEGAEVKPFYDSFPDDLRTNPSITKFKDASALAKSYVELSKRLSGNRTQPLNGGETPEQLAARRAIKRGVGIESVDNYSWKMSNEDRAMGMDLSPMQKNLFDAGVDDETFSAIMESTVKGLRSVMAQEAAENARIDAENEDALRMEWGDNYEVNMRANEIFMRKFPEVDKACREYNFYKIPAFAKMIKQLNELTADGEIRMKRAQEQSDEDVLKSIEDSDAFKYQWHDGHKAAIDKHTDLIIKMAQRGR